MHDDVRTGFHWRYVIHLDFDRGMLAVRIRMHLAYADMIMNRMIVKLLQVTDDGVVHAAGASVN
jgi:hypothetical protein